MYVALFYGVEYYIIWFLKKDKVKSKYKNIIEESYKKIKKNI